MAKAMLINDERGMLTPARFISTSIEMWFASSD
jgi:hypothetical protein